MEATLTNLLLLPFWNGIYQVPKRKNCILTVWLVSSLDTFWIAKNAKFLHADNEDSNQPARMRRLIWVCVWRNCQKVRFLTLRLTLFQIITASHYILCCCFFFLILTEKERRFHICGVSEFCLISHLDCTVVNSYTTCAVKHYNDRMSWVFWQTTLDMRTRCALSAILFFCRSSWPAFYCFRRVSGDSVRVLVSISDKNINPFILNVT